MSYDTSAASCGVPTKRARISSAADGVLSFEDVTVATTGPVCANVDVRLFRMLTFTLSPADVGNEVDDELDAVCLADLTANVVRAVGVGSPDQVVAAVTTLRACVVARHRKCQVQVFQSEVFSRVRSLLVGSDDVHVLRSACELMSSLSVRNRKVVAGFLQDKELVDRLFHLSIYGPPEVACGAVWVLCCMCIKNVHFQRIVCDNASLLHAVTVLLISPSEELRCSACCFLVMLCTGSPISILTRACTPANVQGILAVLSNPVSSSLSRRLAAGSLRALCAENSEGQALFHGRGAVSVLTALLCKHDDVQESASYMWALSALVFRFKAAQDEVATHVPALVKYLQDPSPEFVKEQAATVLYNLAARNRGLQDRIAQAGGVSALTALIPKVPPHGKITEVALTALLSICIEHLENQCAVSAFPSLVPTLARLLSCSPVRICTVACGLIRIMVGNQSTLQSVFAAHGVLVHLFPMFSSKDAFVQEQAVCTLYSLVNSHPGNVGLLKSLPEKITLCDVVEDCVTPTQLAHLCALLSLRLLCDSSQEFLTTVCARPGFVPALLRMSHSSCPCHRTRQHAFALLNKVAPDSEANRSRQVALAVLQVVLPSPAPPEFDCPICMAPGEQIVHLACFHAFHLTCISTWLSVGKDACPLCKLSVLDTVRRSSGTHCSGMKVPSTLLV